MRFETNDPSVFFFLVMMYITKQCYESGIKHSKVVENLIRSRFIEFADMFSYLMIKKLEVLFPELAEADEREHMIRIAKEEIDVVADSFETLFNEVTFDKWNSVDYSDILDAIMVNATVLSGGKYVDFVHGLVTYSPDNYHSDDERDTIPDLIMCYHQAMVRGEYDFEREAPFDKDVLAKMIHPCQDDSPSELVFKLRL